MRGGGLELQHQMAAAVGSTPQALDAACDLILGMNAVAAYDLAI